MLKGVDELRAVAILLVFLYHADETHFGFGWVGVQMFFVISGFLITRILIQSRTTLEGAEFFKNFYGRRALRIFPLYFLYLGGVAMIAAIAIDAFGYDADGHFRLFRQQLPYGLTYTYNVFHASAAFQGTALITHLWSLAAEEQFYFVWPFVIYAVPKRLYKTVFVSILVAGPLVRLAVWLYLDGSQPAWALADHETAIYVLPTTHFDAFALGGLFCMAPPRKAATQAAVFGALLLAVTLSLEAISPDARLGGTLGLRLGMPGPGFRFVWGYTALNYFFGCVLIGAIAYATRTGHGSRPLAYLGRISYGIYVYHYGILSGIKTVAGKFAPELPTAGIAALAIVATVAVSAASFHWFENPINKTKHKLFPRPSGRRGLPAAADALPRLEVLTERGQQQLQVGLELAAHDEPVQGLAQQSHLELEVHGHGQLGAPLGGRREVEASAALGHGHGGVDDLDRQGLVRLSLHDPLVQRVAVVQVADPLGAHAGPGGAVHERGALEQGVEPMDASEVIEGREDH